MIELLAVVIGIILIVVAPIVLICFVWYVFRGIYDYDNDHDHDNGDGGTKHNPIYPEGGDAEYSREVLEKMV